MIRQLDTDDLRRQVESAVPFPHFVVDDFFDADFAVRVAESFALLSALRLIAIATPVFQSGLEETMPEPACLLCSIWVMFAARRLLLTPGRTAIGVFWSIAGREILYWGGITAEMPWPVPALGGMLGWGFPCLAIAGVYYTVTRSVAYDSEPTAIVSACMLASVVASSLVFRPCGSPATGLSSCLRSSCSAVTLT